MVAFCIFCFVSQVNARCQVTFIWNINNVTLSVVRIIPLKRQPRANETPCLQNFTTFPIIIKNTLLNLLGSSYQKRYQVLSSSFFGDPIRRIRSTKRRVIRDTQLHFPCLNVCVVVERYCKLMTSCNELQFFDSALIQ